MGDTGFGGIVRSVGDKIVPVACNFGDSALANSNCIRESNDCEFSNRFGYLVGTVQAFCAQLVNLDGDPGTSEERI